MDSANTLINGLAGERDRWTELKHYFADEIRRLTGDVALSCAFIEYVGPFNAEFRETLLDRFYTDCQRRAIPVTEGLSVTKFMVDESTIGDWTLEGLPSDELSIQNGIMVTRSSKWPLLIDPQGQGLQWLKQRETVNGLKVTQLIDKKFRNVLEDAMSYGAPLVIENVEEELDPIIDPVLDKQVQRKGRALVIVLADKECEYTETFRLFLTSKLANPHFSPELCAQLTVINFTVTMGGLEQQLLARTLQHERAELEEQRQKLVEDVNSNKKILKQLEDDLLFRLANSTGNLLDDTELIDVLNNTKTTSAEVSEKLTNAADTDKRINVAREEYRPVATRGSLLYFLITDMASINPMYQTSLMQFLGLFDASMVNSEKSANMLASKRIGAVIEYMTFFVTCYVQRGLFESHRLVWVLMLAMKIEGAAHLLPPAYIQCLLKAGGALDIKSERVKPGAWLPDAAWLNLIQLSRTVQSVRDVCDSVERNSALWKAWYDEDAPEQSKVPEYGDRLSRFEKLLVVRCLREDRTLLSVASYISESMGQHYMDSRPLDLRSTEEEASHKIPLIALLSQGADPTGIIMELAKKMKKQVQSISMGQGQEPAARKLIQNGTASGSWVMLQNCHLGLKFMVEIEQTILKMDETVNPAFRLWITCEPHKRFPIGLLQLSIKVTNEAPSGIRAGLKASYAWLNQDVLDTVSQPQWKSMLFALCFMHTVVQERRKFGPLGFNVPYEFNQSDLSASVQFMQNHLSDVETKRRPVDWIVVNYMVCEVQYGGRITDDWDRRLFNTYGVAWLTSGILQPNFSFYEHGDLRYAIPAGARARGPLSGGVHAHALDPNRPSPLPLPRSIRPALVWVALRLAPRPALPPHLASLFASAPRALARRQRERHRDVPQVHRGPPVDRQPRSLRPPHERRSRVPHHADGGGARDHPRRPAQGVGRRRRAHARGDRAAPGRRPSGERFGTMKRRYARACHTRVRVTPSLTAQPLCSRCRTAATRSRPSARRRPSCRQTLSAISSTRRSRASAGWAARSTSA
jgi:dynein heavy chain